MRSKAMNGRNPQTAAETRSHALRVLAVRALWTALAILVLTIFFSAVPVALRLTQAVCAGNDCAGQLSPEDARALAALGLSVGFYAWSQTFWTAAIFLTLLVVATVSFWRQPNNRMAILTSFWLVAFSPTFEDGLMGTLIRVEPGWYWPVTFVEALGIWLSLILFYLFPSGKFVPVQARLMLLPVTAYALSLLLFTSLPAVTNVNSVTPLDGLLKNMGAGFLLAAMAAQIYRYRHFSSPVERQQTKWVLFGLALFVLEVIAFNWLPLIFPPSLQPGLARLLYHYLGSSLTHSFLLLFVLLLAIAILRYNLWDIDVIINRTLVYVPLTAILAGLFAATITLSQKAFVALTGQSSDAATVFTTLVVVAAFTPIKDRLQSAVDKRFKEGNAPAQRLNAFQEQLRTRFYAIDPIQVTRRLTEEAVAAFNAKGGAVYWAEEAQPSYTCGEWDGDIQLSAAVAIGERKYGVTALSARRNGHAYNRLYRK